MTTTWLPRFACPSCRQPAAADEADGVRCDACAARYERRDGVYRFLTNGARTAFDVFLQQYRLVREKDGYRQTSGDYYRMLPSVPPDHPRAAEWRIRRESFDHLQRHALPAAAARVLEIGAGCAWLSHRLAAAGCRVVALDRLADEADGLSACRHYTVPFAAVQADFDCLPFEPHQFDVAVFAGSLHYSPDPRATVAEAARVVTPGGRVVVMDSPMFARDADGEAMVADEQQRMKDEHALETVARPGIGFLTFAAVEDAFWAIGMRAAFFPSRGPIVWQLRRQVAWVRLGRPPAAFGVWVAQ